VEAADDHGEALGPELAGQIMRASDLVGLDADQPDHDRCAVAAEAPAEGGRVDARDDLVDHLDPHVDSAERARAHRVLGEAVQAAERIARKRAPPMAHDVPVVIVPRRPNQDNDKAPGRNGHAASPGGRLPPDAGRLSRTRLPTRGTP
jgi:hypothetical protein